VSTHDLDRVALLGGLVFVVLGAVGLVQGVGWIDSGPSWAVIGVVAVLGLAGVALSVRGLGAAIGAPPPEGGHTDQADESDLGESELGEGRSYDEADANDRPEVDEAAEMGSGFRDDPLADADHDLGTGRNR
jgi:hypothetical protein